MSQPSVLPRSAMRGLLRERVDGEAADLGEALGRAGPAAEHHGVVAVEQVEPAASVRGAARERVGVLEAGAGGVELDAARALEAEQQREVEPRDGVLAAA